MKRIGTDFQGWPVNALSLRDILEHIGAKENENGWVIEKNNDILDAYPRVLEDDGMGYGVHPSYITDVDNETYEDNIKTIKFAEDKDSKYGFKEIVDTETIRVFNIFRDVPEHKVEDDE